MFSSFSFKNTSHISTGAGFFAGHWPGNVPSNDWSQLKQSIVNNFDMSLFGISKSGTSVCGTTGDVNLELCMRWHQLGAFLPIFRNFDDEPSRKPTK